MANSSSPVGEKSDHPTPLPSKPSKPELNANDVDLEAARPAAVTSATTGSVPALNGSVTEPIVPSEKVRRRAGRHISVEGEPAPPRRANSLPARPGMSGPPHPSSFGVSFSALGTLLQPEKKVATPPGWRQSAINTLTYSWLNVMLLFIPISWAMHYTHQNPTIIFVFSFLAIIPLAALLGFATEEIALRVGQTLGGLLNATFGNAVELIIAIIALTKNELRVVQASMLGSILSNCLLVLGMCFFTGGLRFHEQGYGVRTAQLQISLLSISVFSIVIPAAFNLSVRALRPNGNEAQKDVLAISRATSIILLVVYAAYLVFQLWTHAYLYSAEASAAAAAAANPPTDGTVAPPQGQSVFRLGQLYQHSNSSRTSSSSSSSEEDEEEPKLHLRFSLLLLVIVTVLTGLTAEYLVSSIDGLTEQGHINKEFVALILLPLVGNAAEHVTAVTVSYKNKLDLAMSVAVGSSIQIALFVLPFLVLLGWIIEKELSLFFDTFETVVVFAAVLVVNYAIGDGKTNWLEGFVLMVVYVVIGVSVWYYPGSEVVVQA